MDCTLRGSAQGKGREKDGESPPDRRIGRLKDFDNGPHPGAFRAGLAKESHVIDRLTESLRFQGQALQLRGERQALLAANVANADTPGYRAVDMDFSRALEQATRSTRPAAPGGQPLIERDPAQAARDGNGVDLDMERARFAENSVGYEAALRALNQQVKSLLAVIQG
jgi:flagellar basal-body rod protein FlgB